MLRLLSRRGASRSHSAGGAWSAPPAFAVPTPGRQVMGRTAAATFSAPTPTPDHRGQHTGHPGHRPPQVATNLHPAFNGTWSREQRSTLLLGCPSPWCERGVYRWADLLPFPHENPLPRRLSPPRRFTPDRRQLHTPTTPLDPYQERADSSYLDQTGTDTRSI